LKKTPKRALGKGEGKEVGVRAQVDPYLCMCLLKGQARIKCLFYCKLRGLATFSFSVWGK
jgi:hypothetical protein